MQAGKAVISTNNGAQTEIITPSVDGILVAPNDVQVLGLAIDQLIENAEERLLLGKRAQKTFQERFSY